MQIKIYFMASNCDRPRFQALDGTTYGALVAPNQVGEDIYQTVTQWLAVGGDYTGQILTTAEITGYYPDYTEECEPPNPGFEFMSFSRNAANVDAENGNNLIGFVVSELVNFSVSVDGEVIILNQPATDNFVFDFTPYDGVNEFIFYCSDVTKITTINGIGAGITGPVIFNIFPFANLQAVYLNNNQITSFSGIFGSQLLHIYNNDLQDQLLLSGSHNEILGANNPDLTGIVFDNFNSISSLDLSDCGLTNTGMTQFINGGLRDIFNSFIINNNPLLTEFGATASAASLTNMVLFMASNTGITDTQFNTIIGKIDAGGSPNGSFYSEGTGWVPAGAALTAKNNLISKGWTVENS